MTPSGRLPVFGVLFWLRKGKWMYRARVYTYKTLSFYDEKLLQNCTREQQLFMKSKTPVAPK